MNKPGENLNWKFKEMCTPKQVNSKIKQHYIKYFLLNLCDLIPLL